MTSFPDKRDEDALEAQLREVFGRIVYTHKTHEKMADRFAAANRFFQWTQTVLAAVTTTALLFVVFGNSREGAVISAVLSTLLLVLNLILQNNDLGRRAEKHTETAAQLWGIRETYLSLITDLLSPNPDIALIKRERDRLQDLCERIFTSGPRTDARAYKTAQRGIKNNEEFTFSEQEIDLLIPEELRKSTRRREEARA